MIESEIRVEKRCLLELRRESLSQRAVKNRITGRVREIRENNRSLSVRGLL